MAYIVEMLASLNAAPHAPRRGRGFPMGLDSSQRCQMRFCVAPRSDEITQVCFARLKCDIR